MEKKRFSWLPLVIGASVFAVLVTGGLTGGLAGCGSNNNPTDGGVSNSVSGYISRVSAVAGGNQILGTLRTGSPSSGSGPTCTATANNGQIAGGTTQYTVTSSASATNLVVLIQGIAGFYELTGLSPGTTFTILITFTANAPPTFTLQVAAGSGTYGTAQNVPVQLDQRAGSGALAFALSWDRDVDLDLHVVEPGGYEIYYAQGRRPAVSPTGGQLDLDSNAACSIDTPDVHTEHVTWPDGGTPPRGTYSVRAHCWSACGHTPTNYTLTISPQGRDQQVYTGVFNTSDCFTGGADAGSRAPIPFTY